MRNTLLSTAMIVALAASAPALAKPSGGLSAGAVACAATTLTDTQPGYVSCLGSFSGNMDNQLTGANGIFAAIDSGFKLSTNTYFSSDNFAASGNPFAQNEGARDDGIINFDRALTGSFVLGLKQGNGFSLYLFNASNVVGGISSIRYDTNGVKAGSGADLSHAGFFGTPVAAVPEPETYAMLIAGLGLMAGVARRRRPQ